MNFYSHLKSEIYYSRLEVITYHTNRIDNVSYKKTFCIILSFNVSENFSFQTLTQRANKSFKFYYFDSTNLLRTIKFKIEFCFDFIAAESVNGINNKIVL